MPNMHDGVCVCVCVAGNTFLLEGEGMIDLSEIIHGIRANKPKFHSNVCNLGKKGFPFLL